MSFEKSLYLSYYPTTELIKRGGSVLINFDLDDDIFLLCYRDKRFSYTLDMRLVSINTIPEVSEITNPYTSYSEIGYEKYVSYIGKYCVMVNTPSTQTYFLLLSPSYDTLEDAVVFNLKQRVFSRIVKIISVEKILPAINGSKFPLKITFEDYLIERIRNYEIIETCCPDLNFNSIANFLGA